MMRLVPSLIRVASVINNVNSKLTRRTKTINGESPETKVCRL